MFRRLCVLSGLSVALTMPVLAADVPPPPVPVAPGPDLSDLWRGHFSGGRNLTPGATKITLDWTDDVEFFPTDGDCRRWLRDRRSAYPTYEGFHGCLRIR